MDYPSAYAALRRENFSARGARNALWLAEQVGTQRFGTLRITAWDGGRGPADYEIRRAYPTVADAPGPCAYPCQDCGRCVARDGAGAPCLHRNRDGDKCAPALAVTHADRLGWHCPVCHDARGTCCYRCTRPDDWSAVLERGQ